MVVLMKNAIMIQMMTAKNMQIKNVQKMMFTGTIHVIIGETCSGLAMKWDANQVRV